MVNNTRQDWLVGAVVKVGFLKLRVLGVRAVKDYMPDIYTLESLDGRKLYEFIPHNGLTAIERPRVKVVFCNSETLAAVSRGDRSSDPSVVVPIEE